MALPCGRRTLLGAGLAAAMPGLAAGPARAQLRNAVAYGKDGWIFPAWEEIRRVDPRRTRQTGACIAEAADILRRAGFGVVLTLAPTRARIYADKLPADFQQAPEVERRYGLALAEMRRSEALVPDLAALLAELRRGQPDPVFFRADSHWTGVAAEAAAAEVAKQIAARFPLPPASRRGTRLGPPEIRTQTNDLASTLPVAEQAAYPPERFRARQVLGGGLLEEEGGEVAIIGNSYMQPLLGFPPMLSHVLDRPVALSWQTARIGPYRTMLDYLGSPLFRRQRPKVLVWHFMEGSMEQPPDAAAWWGPTAMPQAQFLADLRRLAAG